LEILNPSPVAPLPQAMWLTYRAVMENPGLTRDGVLDRVVPAAMRAKTPGGDGSHAARALEALIKLEMVTPAGDGLEAERVDGAATFVRTLRHRVVSPPDAFGSAYDAPHDLRRGLIWLMRQSPAKALDYDVDVAPVTKVFTNPTRWNTFRSWCEVLGFGQVMLEELAAPGVSTGGGKIVPNPTDAVVDVIRHPLGQPLPVGQKVSISQVVEFLRTELPVLPGHPSATFEGLTGSVETGLRALGIALAGAEERAVLDMEYQSDPSGVMALADYDGTVRYVSSVTIRRRNG
jgi:hypothetical protein